MNSVETSKFLQAALVMLLVESQPSFANDFNLRSTLPGSRANLMGGAYTALAEDASGVYYNPAGMAHKATTATIETHRLVQSAISLSNEYTESAENVLEDHDTSFRSDGGFLDFMGARIKTLDNRWTLGVAYLALDKIDGGETLVIDSPTGSFNSFSRIQQKTSLTEAIGIGSSYLLTSGFSFGLSLFHLSKRSDVTDNQLITLADDSTSVVDVLFTSRQSGLMPVLGLSVRGSTFSLGLSARAQIPDAQKTEFLRHSVTATGDGSGNNTAIDRGDTNQFNSPTIVTTAAGAAWHPSPWISLSADGLYHSIEGTNSTVQYESTYNYSAGAEVTLGAIQTRLGVFSNNSIVATPAESNQARDASIDYLGYSLGFGFRAAGGSEVAIGVIAQDGVGKARLQADQDTIQEVKSQSFKTVISTSVAI